MYMYEYKLKIEKYIYNEHNIILKNYVIVNIIDSVIEPTVHKQRNRVQNDETLAERRSFTEHRCINY